MQAIDAGADESRDGLPLEDAGNPAPGSSQLLTSSRVASHIRDKRKLLRRRTGVAVGFALAGIVALVGVLARPNPPSISTVVIGDAALAAQARPLLAGAVNRVSLAGVDAQAVDLFRMGGVDVVVLDISMPGMNGIAALKTLHREQPGVPVVMLSTSTDALTMRHCLKLGALGFVAKGSAYDELIKAIRVVLAGETYLCRIVKEWLAGYS